MRLAQRVPVRIALDALPDGVRLIAGRTATVSVEAKGEGASPRLLKMWEGVAERVAPAR